LPSGAVGKKIFCCESFVTDGNKLFCRAHDKDVFCHEPFSGLRENYLRRKLKSNFLRSKLIQIKNLQLHIFLICQDEQLLLDHFFIQQS
jgi:hypothetical protein